MVPLHTVGFFLLFLLSFTPLVGPALALFMGIAFTWFFGNPMVALSSKASKWMLKVAVIGLGFNVNIYDVLEVGRSSIVLTIVSITAIIGLGEILTQLFRLNKNTGVLISFGTAICGGSAIAAMAPVIKAKEHEIAVALTVVFLLNAIGLMIFPSIGLYFGLSDQQFAVWAALAIHDTSSVVAAAATFSPLAVGIATTIKLTRAMWIIPYTALAGVFWKSEEKASIPLFIVGFLMAALCNTWFEQGYFLWQTLYAGAKHVLVATLFLIGAGVSRKILVETGWRPFAMAMILWIIVSSTLLLLIKDGYIS
ncbi:YeiH family protein [Pseudoalteromonas aurantia]|uniref:Putative sulfate exporter family transporter n=1 Tax=Pseudoalteromonas aurantia TaxID=43654 RepID=A0A5S3VE45_9GAMM|nr:putative sulfate exporter family transporter [Pseudoalteromonas aurantia]TMO70601.1 putative sulfate exporter family transporter [Pseudoalteromonas aurantia]